MENNLIQRILYCDTDCLVVNKAAGEAVEGAGKGMQNLPQLLSSVLDSPDRPQVLPAKDSLPLPVAAHRLDVPVSGCVVFARTQSALRFLNGAFSDNTVNKRYWAVVEPPRGDAGFPDNHTGNEFIELVHWIQFDPGRNKSIAHDKAGPGRKKAILRYRLAGRGRDYLFLIIDLITGRHHQIRAQLAQLGLHVKGDLKYGARRSERGGGIRLHARSLSFPAPQGGGVMSIQADPPLRDNLWLAFEEMVDNGL